MITPQKVLTVSLKYTAWFSEKSHYECLSKCEEEKNLIYYPEHSHIYKSSQFKGYK